MKNLRNAGIAIGAAALVLFAIQVVDGISDRKFAKVVYETETVTGPGISLDIPKGWTVPDYADPRIDKDEFSTGCKSSDCRPSVVGNLSIEREDKGLTIASVIANWQKGQPNGVIQTRRIGSLTAQTWDSQLPGVEVVGEARTYVFEDARGRVYSARYRLARPGPERMRQEYVFGKILESIRFR